MSSIVTAFATFGVASRQIDSENDRSRAQFLAGERHSIYVEYVIAVTEFIDAADAAVQHPATVGHTDDRDSDASVDSENLDAVTQALHSMSRTAVRVNLFGSDSIIHIADRLSAKTTEILVSVVYERKLDQADVEEISDLSLEFIRTAREDIDSN